jgi:hypothetical protein
MKHTYTDGTAKIAALRATLQDMAMNRRPKAAKTRVASTILAAHPHLGWNPPADGLGW